MGVGHGWHTRGWDDESCNAPKGYVCSYEALTVPYVLGLHDYECGEAAQGQRIKLGATTPGLTAHQCYTRAAAESQCGAYFEVSHDGGGWCGCYTGDCTTAASNAGEDVQMILGRPVTVQCASGWTLSDGRCFKFYSSGRNWGNAESTCRTAGNGINGHVAIITSNTQNNQVANLAGSNIFFIGIRRIGGTLQWPDDTPVSWQGSWHGTSEQCTRMMGAGHGWHTRGWDDADCGGSRPFACSTDPTVGA